MSSLPNYKKRKKKKSVSVAEVTINTKKGPKQSFDGVANAAKLSK